MERDELSKLFDGPSGEKLGEEIANRILEDFSLLHTVADALEHETEGIRHLAATALHRVSEHAPESVYPFFERIEKLLDSPNPETKEAAMNTLANLAAVDDEKKIQDKHWQGLADSVRELGILSAAKAIESLGKIAEHTEELRGKIVARMVEYEQVGKDTLDHNEKVQKVAEVFDRIKDKYDKGLLDELEKDLKKGIGHAMDNTAEVAGGLWSKLRKWAEPDDESPKAEAPKDDSAKE